MTEREIAKRLRGVAKAPTLNIEGRRELTFIADELDPPQGYEPGTVFEDAVGRRVFYTERGWIDADGLLIGDTEYPPLVNMKPARIAGPMQEIVDIPPVSEWPDDVGSITQRMIPHRSRTSHTIITREEAERREAEG